MKAITMRIQKFSRPGVILLATVVAIITSIVVANATQTITTPNAAFISYNLAPLTSSAAITLASNRSVLVMGCCTTANDQGVGQMSLLHVPSTVIEWVGLESPSGSPSTVSSGFSFGTGIHMVYIDSSHLVDIQGASVDAILVHNASTGTRAGNVTLVW
jgi:hypothetical protein